MCFNDVVWRTKYDQALNNLAVTDDNKRKIVEAGALPHYVKLLSPERDETIHKEALHGLWMMASEYKHSIVHEPGCLDGFYIDYFEVTYCYCDLQKTRLHDTTCCQTGCIVYTNIQPVVQPGLTTGWMFVYTIQPVVKPLYNRFDNRLYGVNGVLSCSTTRVLLK